jgi:plastocyanin/nitrous oxidase accessory protein NosD
MRWFSALCVLATFSIAAPAAHAATTHHVRVQDNGFHPRVLAIEPGDTVTWTAMETQHTVTADDGRFDFHPGRTLNQGEQVPWRFDAVEEVRYYCRIHGGPGGVGMSGLIRVGTPPPPPIPDEPVVVVPDDIASLRDVAVGAAPGTRVLVRPGVYPESVVVTVPGLEIQGLGGDPGAVVIDGDDTRGVGITVAAAGVRLANLSVTRHRRSGILIHDVAGTSVADTVLRANGLYGIEATGISGLAVRSVHATGHGIAGIGLRDCGACGTRVDGARLHHNAAAVAAAAATGLVVRDSTIHDNALGIVLRDVSGAQVTGNSLADNAATDVWVASVFSNSEPATGAGVWLHGGRDNTVSANAISGHTYNVAVTGAAVGHRVTNNTVAAAQHADLGVDAVAAGLCVRGNRSAAGADPTSDPPQVQTLYDCARPATAGVPYPPVTANLAFHALRVDTGSLPDWGPHRTP